MGIRIDVISILIFFILIIILICKGFEAHLSRCDRKLLIVFSKIYLVE